MGIVFKVDEQLHLGILNIPEKIKFWIYIFTAEKYCKNLVKYHSCIFIYFSWLDLHQFHENWWVVSLVGSITRKSLGFYPLRGLPLRVYPPKKKKSRVYPPKKKFSRVYPPKSGNFFLKNCFFLIKTCFSCVSEVRQKNFSGSTPPLRGLPLRVYPPKKKFSRVYPPKRATP